MHRDFHPDNVLLRPETVTAMKREKGAYAWVYELLQARTGLQIPEVEKLLASLE